MSLQDRDMLYEYLRSILYEEHPPALDLNELSPEYAKLGRALQFLDSSLQDIRTYAIDLARGDLHGPKPLEETVTTQSLRSIEDSIRLMTMQAQAVARGNYEPTDFYLKRYSEAFAVIVEQLQRLEAQVRDTSDSAMRANVLQQSRDALTGAYNRTYLMDHLNTFLLAGWPGSLCKVKVEGLKEVNAEFGQLEGDEYLKRLADALQRGIRGSDTLARVGGDEFCLVLPNCKTEIARRKMAEIAGRLAQIECKYENAFSFGVVELGGENAGCSLNELLDLVQAALQNAKELGEGAQVA